MNKYAPLLMAAGFLALVVLMEQPAPQPTPDEPDVQCGPDLLPVFRKTENKAEAATDAHALECLCDGIAGFIEADGKADKPRLTKAVHFDDFRWRARAVLLDRRSLSSRYPDLQESLRDYLQSTLGDDGGAAVDEPDKERRTLRQRWVEAYRCIAASAKRARERL